MPTSGEARPDPKARTLARGPRRYRRKVASAKQWQALYGAKAGPCRVTGAIGQNGRVPKAVDLHHVVLREHGGDDVADNLVPVTRVAHDLIHKRDPDACRLLLESLTDAEYAYAIQRGGEGYFERAYGVEYSRPVSVSRGAL